VINKARRVRQVYTCIPEELNRREADPFDYKLRSLAEVEEQMKYFPPDVVINAAYRKYTSSDRREGHENNLETRDRISVITIDIRELNLQPLQKERLIFLLGPRYDPKKPHQLKVVSKRHLTFLENYF